MFEAAAQDDEADGTDKQHYQQSDYRSQGQIELILHVGCVGRDHVLDRKAGVVILRLSGGIERKEVEIKYIYRYKQGSMEVISRTRTTTCSFSMNRLVGCPRQQEGE